MRDPNWIDPQAQRIPGDWRRKYLTERTLDQLRVDVTGLYDRNWRLEREKDGLRSELDRSQKDLRNANLKVWIMGLIVSPIIAAILKAVWVKLFP